MRRVSEMMIKIYRRATSYVVQDHSREQQKFPETDDDRNIWTRSMIRLFPCRVVDVSIVN